MGLFETVTTGIDMKKGIDAISSIFGGKTPEKEPPKVTAAEKPSTSNAIFNFLLGKPETKDNAEKIQDDARNEREGIFGSVFDGVLARYYPTLSKIKDLKDPRKIYESIKKDPSNIVNEMDSILADTLFVPDFLLKYFTDPLIQTDAFKKIVEAYDSGLKGILTPNIPGADTVREIPVLGLLAPEKQNWYEKIYGSANYDPDDVINFMRIILKDKNTLQAVIQKVL
jgi:hypothetical protein